MTCRLTDRQAALELLPTQPTLVDVVAATGMDYTRARHAMSDFVRHGKARIVRKEPRPHSRKPVAVYAPADALEDLAREDDGQPWSTLQSVWR